MPAPDAPSRDALAAALDFYRHVGVDIAIDETPRDWFAETQVNATERDLPPNREPRERAGRPTGAAGLEERSRRERLRDDGPRDRPRAAPPALPEASRPLNPALAADAAAVAASAKYETSTAFVFRVNDSLKTPPVKLADKGAVDAPFVGTEPAAYSRRFA